MTNSRIRDAVAQAAGFNFEFDEVPDYCEYAEDFARWAEALAEAAVQKHMDVALNQAKVLLLDRYYEWLNSIPRRHHSLTGRLSHPCIDVVFDLTYRRLRHAELRMSPPPLAVPPTQSRAEPILPLLGTRFGDVIPTEEDG